MEFRFKKLVIVGVAAVLTGSMLGGCSKKKAAPPAVEATAPVEETRPGGAVQETLVLNATVQKVNRKKRIVTLKFPDGRKAEVKCGPEVRNFPQIQVGDDVTVELDETVELFVVGPDGRPAAPAEEATIVGRAPKGRKPAVMVVRAAEVTATVEAIDYNTREVTLKTPDGKRSNLTVSPKVKRLNAVKLGDTVVARLTEAVSIQVTSPQNAPAKKTN
jgi:hypothetical protein